MGRARLAIEDLHAALQTLVADHMAEGVNVSDTRGVLQFTNPAFDRMFGYEPGELIGRHVSVLNGHAPEQNQDLVRGIIAALDTAGRWQGQFDNVKKTGERFTTRATISALELSGETYWISVQEDISEQRALESQLRESEKMRAIGQLAGGIAHDFNNVLTIIMANQVLLESKLARAGADDPELQRPLGEIRDASRRAAAMTKQLLLFSRQDAGETQLVETNDVLRAFECLVQRLLPATFDIVFDYADDAPNIQADATSLEQIVLNLVVNARDASPNGGRIDVATRRVADFLQLSVTDTGHGMDDATAARVFEPFFTTKAAGDGSGLGLAIVYGIASRLGGYVDLSTAPGEGTRFDIYLPAAA